MKHFAKHIGKYNLGNATLSINRKQAYAEALDEKISSEPHQADRACQIGEATPQVAVEKYPPNV